MYWIKFRSMMMTKKQGFKNLLIVGMCLGFFGCAHVSDRIVKPFVDPQYGMTRKQMVDLLGKPQKVEIYKKFNQTLVEFDFYPRGNQTSQATVPVCLVNNKVVGWGKTFYEDHVSDDDLRIK